MTPRATVMAIHHSRLEEMGFRIILGNTYHLFLRPGPDVIRGFIGNMWLKPLEDAEDPLATIIDTIRHMDTLAGEQIITLGCPLNNLAQEMSPLDEGFRQRIDRVYRDWRTGLAQALEWAREHGQLRADVDCAQVATFIVAALTGCIGIAKNSQSREPLDHCGAGLISYLESLRA